MKNINITVTNQLTSKEFRVLQDAYLEILAQLIAARVKAHAQKTILELPVYKKAA